MLVLHSLGRAPLADAAIDLSSDSLPADVLWLDLMRPEADERAFVERIAGVRVPSIEDLSEIESSSRLRRQRDVLYLSAPLVTRSNAGESSAVPVGFILTKRHLITVRFEDVDAVRAFAEQLRKPEGIHPSSGGVFVGLLEEIVDGAADVLERVGSELGAVSRRVFGAETRRVTQPRRPGRESNDLRAILRRVGRNGDLASDIRDSLLTIGRIVPFVAKFAAEWMPSELKPRLETLEQDVTSLNDYEAHLTNKVQLVLDATLGLINIEQNNIIKVLTVVSVVGVPPTLIASMYGMNFRHMPELDWAWGYPYAIALIAISALAPLAWFKWRGWL